jgi:GT2 family glycosyltransferase
MICSIAAIIPTYRRWSYLIETVRHLNAQSVPPAEIVIVDQTPRAEIPEGQPANLISGSKIPVVYEHRGQPLVYHARNQAVLLASVDVLLWLDDDITPVHDLVKCHLRHFGNPAVSAVVGSVVQAMDDKMLPVPDRFRNAGFVEQAFTYSGRFTESLQNVGFMCAGNFSVRREAFVRVGGWDEHILNYGDRDLGIRLCSAGFRIDYDPEAKIVHHAAGVGGTRVTDPYNSMEPWERCVSLHYLAWRHLHGWMFVKYGLYRAARFSFLLRRNALRPSVWPQEVAGFARAFFVARRWSKEGVKSPFVAPMAGQ